MRRYGFSRGDTRSSALWGKPSKGESRSSALWGKGGRGFVTTLVVGVLMATPMAAMAGSGPSRLVDKSVRAYLSPGLYDAASASPNATFNVIVQGAGGATSSAVASDVANARRSAPGKGVGLRKRFRSVAGVAAQLTGRQIVKLAHRRDIRAITSDAPVMLSAFNAQRWPHVAGLSSLWDSPAAANAPTIAIVDSGIENGRSDFGSRILADVTMTSLPNNSPGDGRGHGTFVAAIAAGSAPGYGGGSQRSNIVSIDVMDDQGMAMTRDVIAAADWILAHKDEYNIRVANFSLHSAAPASVFFDPLDAAVERLWFGGVVVVAAAGNYGVDGAPSDVMYAPGNDPFVITVGADDVNGSISTYNDFAAPWSVYGYTLDGFAKPELSAPGRYMISAVPATSTLVSERPENVRYGDHMQLSGTSFSAPVVAAAAAQVLAAHPGWTPDQVKGALMLTTQATPYATPGSLGVGIVNAAKAVTVSDPPNPNLALNQFVVAAGDGSGPVFDAASWANVAMADASWANASWANASWANASWANASWASASWAGASWANASWASASWASASWANASWASASWANASWANASWANASWANASWASQAYADNAEAEMSTDGEELSPEELDELETELP
jgi:serine protease AprX